MERQEMEGKQRGKVLLVTHVSGFVPQFEMNNVRILQSIDAAMACAVIGLLVESFFLVNYRQPMFWMILLYGSVAGGCRGGDV